MIKKIPFFHHSVAECFQESIDIVGICNLIDDDITWQGMYSCLLPFKSFKFSHNQRFLILHHDTDYYPTMDSCGNFIYNMIKIIAELDISTEHIIILSASLGEIQKEIEYQCLLNNISPIRTLDFSLWYTWPTDTKITVRENPEKKYLFSCLNGVPRTHRKTLMALLHRCDLIDHGLISWNPNQTGTTVDRKIFVDQLNFDFCVVSNLRITAPKNSAINEELSLCPDSKKLHVQYQLLLDKSVKSDEIVGQPNSMESRWVADYLQESLVYVISETVGQYPYVYFSEKTWKAMMSMMPFMLLGAPGSLAKLKDMGFRTFSDFWDENYDQLPSLLERGQAIVDNLLMLKNKNLQDLYKKMRPIVLHNRQQIEIFQRNELLKIKNLI